MSDETTVVGGGAGGRGRDAVVAGALATIAVPDHGDDFWARLAAALDAEPTPTADGGRTLEPTAGEGDGGGAVVAIGRADRGSDGAARRARVLFAVAAAVVLVVAVAAVLVGGDGDGGRTMTSPDPSPSITTPPPTPDPTAGPPVGLDQASPEAVVQAFIERVAAGDTELVRAILGPQSVAYLAEMDDEGESLLVGSAEGYGSWVSSVDQQVTTIELRPGAAVVVLAGTRQSEGALEERIDGIPARQDPTSGAWLVEPFAFGPGETTPEPIVPEVGNGLLPVPTDATLVFSVIPGGSAFLAIDDDLVSFDDSIAREHRFATGGLSVGTHVLVLASIGPDWFTAFAGPFEAVG